MRADIQSYLDSWSTEIAARKDRVRQLIGDAHWLSDGHHKESILREFLLRYLPRNLNISRGFVKTTRDLGVCSPEVDILITDPTLNPPYFSEGDLQIVDASAVIAQIEVKTTLSKRTLEDALLNICRTQSIVGSYQDADRVWKGVCFFSGSTKSPKDLLNMTEAGLRAVLDLLARKQMLGQVIAPTCIASLDRHCCFLHQTASNTVSIKLFDLGSLSFPCAFADLFSALRRRNGGVVLGGLDNVVESLHVAAPLTREVVI